MYFCMLLAIVSLVVASMCIYMQFMWYKIDTAYMKVYYIIYDMHFSYS